MPILTHIPISREDHLLQTVSEKIINPGSTVIDVGVNYMQNTRFFLKCVGHTGKVIGFEPNNVLYETIKYYTTSRGPKFEIYPNVLAAAEKVITFRQFEDPNSGQSGILENISPRVLLKYATAKYQDIVVNTSSLDKLITEQSIIGRLSLIKIDCEGGDCEVLQGGINLIQKYCSPIIIELSNHKKKALSILLRDIEYRCYSLATKQPIDDLSLTNELNGLLVSNYDKHTLRSIQEQ